MPISLFLQKAKSIYSSGMIFRLEMDTIHYLSLWEWEALLEQASGRDRLIILLLYDSGMRVGELVTTKVEDIDFEHCFIRIQSSRTKTKSFRTCRICQHTLQAVKEYVQPGQEWLFHGRCSGHLSKRTIQLTLDRLAQAAGIQQIGPRKKLMRRRITPHSLRHSHIVSALMTGVPLPLIQQQVGHKCLSSTQVYATVAPVLVQEAYTRHGFSPVRNEQKQGT